MSRKRKRVCFGPDANEKPTIFLTHGCRGGGGGSGSGGCGVLGKKKRIMGTWTFRFPKDPRLSPVKFLQRLGAKVASAIRVVSMRRRSSRKVSSSSIMVRSHSLSDTTDSHRAKAVEDCIEFLHSSSSRERPS